MLKLYGFPLSNYHNKVKLALLEKGVPFEEVTIDKVSREDWLAHSPLGKVPYIENEQGAALCESQAIIEYIEARWPTPALLPADPWAAAKLRELNLFLELHLELVARQLYGPAFFGLPPLPEKFTERVRAQLEKNIAAFKRLAKFAPYVGGDSFTMADCSAYCHLPLVAMASRATYGVDLLAAADVDWKSYVKLIDSRSTAQKVAAERKADQGRAARMGAALAKAA
ncbi:MAG TPA: glutathione S-transferase [Methylibium sp.]